jgi:hypothetical protein
MIFKPSSIRKLFFTYFCPTFYGGPPAAPSNTTSTQTINQSPWQNPVYQALMLGTADKPGPVTSMLRSGAEQTAAWDAMNAGGFSPVPKQAQYTAPYTPSYTPPATTAPASDAVPVAAKGGIMSLKGYKAGGPTEKQKAAQIAKLQKTVKGETAAQHAARVQKIIDLGGTPNDANTSFMQNYTDASANKYEGKIDPATGVESLRPRGATESAADYKKYTDDSIAAGASPTEEMAKATAAANLKNTLGTAITTPTADVEPKYDDKGNIVGYKSTNEDFQKLQQAAKDLSTPEQFKTATDMYGRSSAGLEAAAGYKPTDIAAQKADVATMQGAGDVASDKLQQYQMQGPGAVTAPTAEASQMAGPKSWIDKGTSEAYMSPYMQNVVDIQKREANRDYQQQLNQLNAQSVQAGAFGGSRQAIQQAEAARNQATRLGDIEAKGLQEAYTSGMGQFTNEQGQTIDVGKANLSASQQATLANQAAEIQAMMANQGMDYNTALQNLQAKLGIQNTQAGNDLQAALANQQTQQQTQTINTAAQNAANQQYATQDLTAQQANQQAGLTANQQGIAALQGVGQNASGLSSTGTAENQAGIANLGAQGQVVQAGQALSQQGMTNNQQTALNALGATNQINAGSVAAVNAQPVQGGTQQTTTNQPHARGGLIKNGKVSKRGMK